MDQSRAAASISITMLHDGRVLLELLTSDGRSLGASETHVDDRERTAGIVRNWVTGPRPEAERRGPYRPGEYRDGYSLTISAVVTRDLTAFSQYGHSLIVDFTRAFGSSTSPGGDPEPLANALPRDLAICFRRARQQSVWRIADGAYIPILAAYLAELRGMTSINQQNAYQAIAPSLGVILDDERYLLVAADEQARRLYLELLAERSSLYNWYMDLARGGVARSRRS